MIPPARQPDSGFLRDRFFGITEAAGTQLFFAVITFTRGQNAGAPEIADDLFFVRPLHYRQTADVMSQHSRDGVVQCLVGISDAQVGRSSNKNSQRFILRAVKSTHDVAARDDAGQLTFLVRQQCALVRADERIATRNPRRKTRQRRPPGMSGDRLP